jgi:hypothetical protein
VLPFACICVYYGINVVIRDIMCGLCETLCISLSGLHLKI